MYYIIERGDKKVNLLKSDVIFKTYSGEVIKSIGRIEIPVEYNNQNRFLTVEVIDGSDKSCLIGRDWLYEIKLDWYNIFNISIVNNNRSDRLKDLMQEFDDIFGNDLGLLKGEKAKIYLNDNAIPKFCKARTVPYALKQKVECELERMIHAGILEPVDVSDWATPIVPVRKPDNSVRLCGDYKITVNQASKLDNYPIPKIDDLFSEMSGCVVFSKLDLKHAYQQMELDEDSKHILTLNTHKGLFRPTRLCFGVKSATGIFQRAIENRLKGIENTVVRVDDILVGGRDLESKFKNLRKVFQVLKDSGLRLKKEKCVFMKESVIYLGMKIDKNGIKPVKERIDAIMKAPAPRDTTELKSFLGMLTYYHKHLPNVANLLEPLHKLLRKDEKWKWGAREEDVFEKAKELLMSADLLVHYDPEKPLLLACDASPYGVGVVLSHMVHGIEKPIAYASKTLNSAERNYSQIEKEGLAVLFGVKKFHQYCYDRHFTIISDHKPLEGLLGENKPISGTSIARMQRWAVILSSYDYTFMYREGRKHGNADALSRLPVNSESSNIDPDGFPFENIRLLDLDCSPVTALDIKKFTKKDADLQIVTRCIMSGSWESTNKDMLTPYFCRRHELSIDQGCVLWGSRVVIPKELREVVLNELHECHPGINRMKALARSYVWWPKLDQDIETKVKKCNSCQENRNQNAKAAIHPWEWTNQPWVRLHIDHAGPFLNKFYLIIIDSYSKWLEVIPTKADTQDTIDIMRRLFATHGLPEQIVSDNGSPFTSRDFEEFLQRNGIQQIRTSPYHASSNGIAERSVQTFKKSIRKMSGENDFEKNLQKFLFTYRITPQTTTGRTPAELLMRRRLTSALDLIRPNVNREMQTTISNTCNNKNRSKGESLNVEDTVYVRNFGQGSIWWEGKIINRQGPLTWLVKLTDGRIIQRHIDHIRIRYPVDVDSTLPNVDSPTPASRNSNSSSQLPLAEPTDTDETFEQTTDLNEETNSETVVTEIPPMVTLSEEEKTGETTEVFEKRRSTRVRKPPERFGF